MPLALCTETSVPGSCLHPGLSLTIPLLFHQSLCFCCGSTFPSPSHCPVGGGWRGHLGPPVLLSLSFRRLGADYTHRPCLGSPRTGQGACQAQSWPGARHSPSGFMRSLPPSPTSGKEELETQAQSQHPAPSRRGQTIMVSPPKACSSPASMVAVVGPAAQAGRRRPG